MSAADWEAADVVRVLTPDREGVGGLFSPDEGLRPECERRARDLPAGGEVRSVVLVVDGRARAVVRAGRRDDLGLAERARVLGHRIGELRVVARPLAAAELKPAIGVAADETLGHPAALREESPVERAD